MHLPSRASFADDAVSASENCINAYKPENQKDHQINLLGQRKGNHASVPRDISQYVRLQG
jgi:hypothetical protein